jgi:hypothetical protein
MASIGGKKLSQLRVVDLRLELEKRNLDKSGLKEALVKRLEKSLLEEATDLLDKDNNHDEADCNGDLANTKDVLLSLAHQATCNCACSSTLEDIVNMKLNMEILRSRVDA